MSHFVCKILFYSVPVRGCYVKIFRWRGHFLSIHCSLYIMCAFVIFVCFYITCVVYTCIVLPAPWQSNDVDLCA